MMRMGRILPAVLFVAALLVAAPGCKKEEKPAGLFERMGESTDKAVEKTTEAAGSAVDKTREKTGEALEKAGEAVKPDQKKD